MDHRQNLATIRPSNTGATTLRAELPDQCTLSGLIQRVVGLHLEITQVQLVGPPPAQ